ncbi:MAG: restriction endonuclease subunit M, partial [Gemmatimonadota bacterium]|nr:restriction endonuclease subunit M [Gemmatimonadota bacterium]
TPRYYNPEPQEELEKLSDSHECISFKTLVEDGAIEVKTGDEVGKLAYGTGSIPFVRTSDISNWEVKLDPKHGVSDEIYNQYKDRQDVREGDILMVRDGTYLIGTCAYISKYDTKIVFQSHLYKIRVNKPEVISPFLLLAALSSKPAIGQIQAKRFTQDIIDSLGNRIYELILPIPKDKKKRDKVERMVRKSINDRVESRELARRAKLEITAL